MSRRLCGLKRALGAALAASLAIGVAGCGGDGGDPVQAQAAMDKGFASLHEAMGLFHQEAQATTEADKATFKEGAQAKLRESLANTNSSIAEHPTQEAMLVKAYVQIGLDQLGEAHETLDLLEARFAGAEDQHVHALLLSKEGGPPAEILADLTASYDAEWSGMDESTWWKTIDGLPGFAHFRASPEYAQLLLRKVKPTASVWATTSNVVCRDNVTKVKARWFGMQYWFNHEDTGWVVDGTAAAGFFASLIPVPGLDVVLAGYFAVESAWISLTDRNCGVVLTAPWLAPVLFIPTAQK